MSTNAAALLRSPWADNAGRRRLFADLAVLTTGAAVLGLFAISAVLLEHFGISYISPGGGAASKFHPSTFLSVLAFILRCLSTRYPLRTGWRLLTDDSGVVLLLIASTIAFVFAVLVSKTPATPLIDTFVLPILCFVLLRDLDAVVLKWFALGVVFLLCINAVMAMFEFSAGWHFFTLHWPFDATSDPTRSDAVFDWRVEMAQDWRAVALLGHPLVNGLTVGCFITCLAAPGSRWLPVWIKAPLALLQFVSMFTFGARASLVMMLIFSTYLVCQQFGAAILAGARITPRAIAISIVAVGLAIAVALLLLDTGFFDRTIDRFANDAGSAQTRTTMFELFRPFTWSELLLGPDQDAVATQQRVYGLEFGIESSWIGLALTYGLLVTSIILLGLAAFSRSVIRACGRGGGIILGFYFISVSATASMSGKTTGFAMAMVLALIFLSKDERQLPLRSSLGLETV